MSRAADMVLAFWLLSSWTALARGEQAPRVATLVPPASAAMTARIRAELAAAGFELRVVQPLRWPPSRDELAELARKSRLSPDLR